MNVREEDKRKTSNTTRGLATAAIGLGIGAALYYFLSKGSPHPDNEGATSSGWTHERVFRLEVPANDSDSYSTISEGTTSDTSVHDETLEVSTSTSQESDMDDETSNYDSSHNTSEATNTDSTKSEFNTSSSTQNESDSQSLFEYSLTDSVSQSENDDSDTEDDYAETEMSSQTDDDAMDETDLLNLMYNGSNRESLETGYTSMANVEHSGRDSETENEWEVTNTSLGIPSEERNSSLTNFFGGLTRLISPRKTPQDDRLSKLREQAFRERPWTLEECSICFDVMLRDQEIMTLSCTHNFHAQCIMPWLQEKQTCPNCRKQAD